MLQTDSYNLFLQYSHFPHGVQYELVRILKTERTTNSDIPAPVSAGMMQALLHVAHAALTSSLARQAFHRTGEILIRKQDWRHIFNLSTELVVQYLKPHVNLL